MYVLAMVMVGIYLCLLAIFLLSLGAFLSSSTDNGAVLSIVSAGYSFVGLVVTFPIAYFSLRYVEKHRDDFR